MNATKSIFGILAFTAAFVLEGRAQIFLLSDDRSVAVTGVAGGLDGGQSFSYSQTPSAPFSPFNGSVAGSASWTDSSSPYPGGLPQSYDADGSVSQSSVIAGNSMSLQGQLSAYAWVGLQGPYGPASAQGQSILEVSFSVQTAQTYTLVFDNSPEIESAADATESLALTSADGSELLSPQDVFDWTYSGILDPGIYTLSMDANVAAGPDPLGSTSDIGYDMEFSVVPEPGTIGLGVLGAAAFVFRRRAGNGV